MDLDRFDTREKAEAGVDIPLVVKGKEILGNDGLPVTFKTKGLADPEVHKVLLNAKAAGILRTPEEVFASDMKLARAGIIGWSSNFDVKGEFLEFSAANLAKVMGNPIVRNAALNPIYDEDLFMNGS